MFVLALDTSSAAVTAGVVEVTVASVAPLATRQVVNPRGHGELLAPLIAGCLDEARLAVSDVEAVVAGTGPGPFTGLRVGLVTAAVLADALHVPAHGVSSLDAIAVGCAGEPDLLVVTDARRREVYWARYRNGERVDGPGVAKPGDVPRAAAVTGRGAALYPDVWPDPLAAEYPTPTALVELAADRLRARVPGEPLTPLYLRRPDAVVPGAPKPVSR